MHMIGKIFSAEDEIFSELSHVTVFKMFILSCVQQFKLQTAC
jgi:hypothetical protein